MAGSMMNVLFTRPFWTASAQKITMVNFVFSGIMVESQ